MIIWKALIPDKIVRRCFRAKRVILISRPRHTRSRTLYRPAPPNPREVEDAAADLLPGRHFGYRTNLHDTDNAFDRGQGAAAPGRKGAYTFVHTRQNLSRTAEPRCSDCLFSGIQKALIV